MNVRKQYKYSIAYIYIYDINIIVAAIFIDEIYVFITMLDLLTQKYVVKTESIPV